MNGTVNERQMLDPAELGGIVAERAGALGTEAWLTAAGLEGALLLSPHRGMNGYVRLPEPFRGRRVVDDDLDVRAPGGLTFGMDEGGWVGFDTAHGWDTWLDPDVPETEHERHVREQGLPPIDWPVDEHTNVWTIEKVRDAVERVAAEVAIWCSANRDFDGAESAAEREERVRREMRRFAELAGIDGEALPRYDHARTSEAIRRLYAPTVAEVEEDHAAGLLSDREYEWKLADARSREATTP